MDELRPEELAAALAAWHNRHPLARRIAPAQVQGIGWVALPFVQRPGAAPWAAPGELPVLVDGVDEPAAGVLPAGPELQDQSPVHAQAAALAAEAARPLPPASGPLPQRLLATFKQGLRALMAAPTRLRGALQAVRLRRAQLELRAKALQPAFSEDFIAPLSSRQVARWALRHGRLQVRSAGLPVREVRPDAQWGRQDTGLVTLYVATAAFEVGSRRARVLLPSAGTAGALGPRLWSPQRSSAALAMLLAIGLGIARPALPPAAEWSGLAALQAAVARWSAPAAGPPAGTAGPAVEVAQAAAVPASAPTTSTAPEAQRVAADAASSASEAPPAPTEAASGAEASPGAAVAVAPGEAPASAVPASAALALARPRTETLPLPGADPVGGAATLPPDDPAPTSPPAPFRPGQRLVPPLDEATKAAARETVAALRAARGDPPPAPKPTAGPLTVAQDLARPPGADPGPELGPAYALTTRPLRTRAESEQVQMAVRALLAQHTAEPLLVELMPVGDDWRVVCWPFTRRQDAQLARALLLTRGLRMEAVEF